MPDAADALQGAFPPPPRLRPPARPVWLLGAGGVLGSAVLERLLGVGRFAPVRALVTRSLKGQPSGFEPVLAEAFTGLHDAGAWRLAGAELAVIVFDRPRHANGRDAVFVRPAPHELSAWARHLRRHGVRDLVVVLPHAPAGLPEALKRGLASLDEQAVAALGFEHLVFVRSAEPAQADRPAGWLQRLAGWMLRQLALMLPAAQQPVKAAKVAAFVAELAARLPESRAGTRVVPPELVWIAARQGDVGAVIDGWLDRGEWPAGPAPAMRL